MANLSFGGLTAARSVALTRPFGETVPFWIGRCMARVPRALGTSITPKGYVSAGAGGCNPEGVVTKAFAELVERVTATLALPIPHDEPLPTPWRADRPMMWPNTGPCTWVAAVDLVTGQAASAPALLVYLQWHPPRDEPLFARPDATGLAAALNADEAIMRGMLEVIERDAAINSWIDPDWPVSRIHQSDIGDDVSLVVAAIRCTLAVYSIGRPTLPPVVLAVLQDSSSGVTVGTACRTSLTDAATHAIEEALTLLDTVRRHRPAETPPKSSSLSHVSWAFVNGHRVSAVYAERASHELVGSHADRTWTLSQVATGLADVFRCPVLGAKLSLHAACDWQVWRAIVPTAARPASHPTLVLQSSDPPAHGQDAKVKMLNPDPHPFG